MMKEYLQPVHICEDQIPACEATEKIAVNFELIKTNS